GLNSPSANATTSCCPRGVRHRGIFEPPSAWPARSHRDDEFLTGFKLPSACPEGVLRLLPNRGRAANLDADNDRRRRDGLPEDTRVGRRHLRRGSESRSPDDVLPLGVVFDLSGELGRDPGDDPRLPARALRAVPEREAAMKAETRSAAGADH